MARFHAIVLAASIGAVVGTILRPGIPEIMIVAFVVWCAWPALLKFTGRHFPVGG